MKHRLQLDKSIKKKHEQAAKVANQELKLKKDKIHKFIAKQEVIREKLVLKAKEDEREVRIAIQEA